ncbi:MipA/OmpV family protein [Alteromonas sp. D210916BOD_24]|uniref:MipA/OmpV family protein n=1 Tax=Alteromonas sp. D210916BOD_24 TaxID=3157618 RepID=UPI00399C983C
MITRYLLFLFIFVLFPSWALACDNEAACIEEAKWSVGIAIGVGARTNPLVDGNSIPLVLLPDLAFYDEHVYFDNGELGYQWNTKSHTTTSLFLRPSVERAFFSFWDPANILIPSAAISDGNVPPSTPYPPDGEQGNEPRYISLDEISHRDWTLDTGVRVSWVRDSSDWSLTLAHDALGVYSGYSIEGQYQHYFHWGDWRLAANVMVTYKNNRLINYYYGIDQSDTDDESLWYQAPHSFQVSTGLFASKPINAQWRWLTRLQITAFDSGMSDSPLVSKRHIVNAFVGIGYRF